jgi:hypothetical protein
MTRSLFDNDGPSPLRRMYRPFALAAAARKHIDAYNERMALERRDRGIETVGKSAVDFLRVVRERAKQISADTGEVTADDLRRWAMVRGIKPHDRNAWGAVFRPVKSKVYPERPGWQFLRHTRSTWRTNNARVICVWRWVP